MYDEIASEPLPERSAQPDRPRRRQGRRRKKPSRARTGKKIAARNFRGGRPLSGLTRRRQLIMLASEDKKKALTSPSSVFKHPARRCRLRRSQQGREDRHPQAVGTRCPPAPGRHRGRHERGRAQPVRRRQEGAEEARRRHVLERRRRADQGRTLSKQIETENGGGLIGRRHPSFATRRSARPACSELVLNAAIVLRRAAGMP